MSESGTVLAKEGLLRFTEIDFSNAQWPKMFSRRIRIAILVALTLAFRRDSTTDILEDAIREITKALRQADDRITYVYVRPSQQANQSNG